MKITRVINVAALMLGVLLLCQCTKEEKSAVQPQANVPATVKMAYIDSDSLAAKYNFAKDIFEANQRAQNKLENVRQQRPPNCSASNRKSNRRDATTATLQKKATRPTCRNTNRWATMPNAI